MTTEIKIEDLEQDIAGCTDRKEKKSLQTQLKKLQEDPKYEQAQKDIVQMEAELRRLALHEQPSAGVKKVVTRDEKISRKAIKWRDFLF